MLTALLIIPIIGAISILLINNNNNLSLIKQIALGYSLINFLLSLIIWNSFDNLTNEYQFVQEFGSIKFFHFYFGIDGISLFFVLLTTFITPFCILSSWNNIKFNIQYYLATFLILETLLIAVFI